MSNSFIIEVRSEPAGIVVRDGRAFRFYAASRTFGPLEGRFFNTPHAAHRAVVRHLAARRTQSARHDRPHA